MIKYLNINVFCIITYFKFLKFIFIVPGFIRDGEHVRGSGMFKTSQSATLQSEWNKLKNEISITEYSRVFLCVEVSNV